MERFRGRVCGIENCRSRNYYRESGLVYCLEGHRQPEGFAVGENEDAFGSQGRKSRKKAEEKDKVYQHYSGHKAFELYLQCYQLILWKQSYWLVHEKGFPPELEIIVHDLWALRLQHLRYKVETAIDENAGSQIFSSQPTGDTDTETEVQHRGRKGRRLDSTPKLIDTLALCYIGLLLLRLPVSIGDMHRWARDGEIVYFRVIQELPFAMKQRLPATYHEALAPNALLQPDHLHDAFVQLAITYQRDLGMTLPPLNYPLILFRYTKELALPIDMYQAVQRLAKLLSYTFDFSRINKNPIRISDLPEPKLISLLIVAVKLAYPFDDIPRYPLTATEPAALAIDWSIWEDATSQLARQKGKGSRLMGRDAFDLKEEDIYSMTGTQVDGYLSFYDRYWVDGQAAEHGRGCELRQALSRMFPTDIPEDLVPTSQSCAADQQPLDDQPQGLGVLETVHRSLRARKPISEKDAEASGDAVLRPGSQYKHYRKESDLNDHAKAFYERAAKLTGLSLGSLITAVFQTEMRLQKWTASQRKRDRDGSSVNNVDQDDDEAMGIL